MSMTFAVVYGSVRSARQGIKLARVLVHQLETRGHAVSLLDAQHDRLPLLDKMCKEYEPNSAPAPLEEIARIIRGADGTPY